MTTPYLNLIFLFRIITPFTFFYFNRQSAIDIRFFFSFIPSFSTVSFHQTQTAFNCTSVISLHPFIISTHVWHPLFGILYCMAFVTAYNYLLFSYHWQYNILNDAKHMPPSFSSPRTWHIIYQTGTFVIVKCSLG